MRRCTPRSVPPTVPSVLVVVQPFNHGCQMSNHDDEDNDDGDQKVKER